MSIDYYKMPFGAQLLLWTSRIILYGNCRISPNKYEIVNEVLVDGNKINSLFKRKN